MKSTSSLECYHRRYSSISLDVLQDLLDWKQCIPWPGMALIAAKAPAAIVIGLLVGGTW